MDGDGLWDLFFATGLPEVYLALRGEKNEEPAQREEAMTAFRPERGLLQQS